MRHILPALASIGLLASPPGAQGWFDIPRTYPTLAEGQIRALADIDSDGDVDAFAVGGFGGPGVFVWRNDGAGEFAVEPKTPIPELYEVSGDPLVGDVTDDGVPDLVYRYTADGQEGLLVVPGNPTGPVGAPIVVPTTGGFPSAFTLGDSDGAGGLEIAVAHSVSGSSDRLVRWFDWDGAQFASSAPLEISAFQPHTHSLSAIDLEGDGDDDLVAGTGSGSDLLLLSTVAGAPVLRGTLPVPMPFGFGRFSAVGDLEGDGDVDLVAIDYDTVVDELLFVVFESDGAGSLVAGAAHSLPAELGLVLRLGDWDGDGDLDFAHHDERATLFENHHDTLGSHTFSIATSYQTNLDGEAVGLADVDLDGNLDFVLRTQVLFGDGTFFELLPDTGVYPQVLYDWEGDGDVDGFLSDGRVAVNDGTGSFGVFPSWPSIDSPTLFYQDAVGFADYDGDGRRDWVVGLYLPGGPFLLPPVFQQMRFLRDDGLGGFVDVAPASNLQMFGDITYPAVDLDGDGDVDQMEKDSLWLNDGAGSFTKQWDVWEGHPEDAADLDGDGDMDVIVFDAVYPSGDVALERQEAGFTFSTEVMETTNPTNFLEDSLRLLDVDLDGDLDAVASGVRIYENQGGVFAPPVVLAGGSTVDSFALEDVDGDGRVDLVGTHREDVNGAELLLVYRDTPAGYEPVRTWWANARLGNWVDVDGDGDLDASGFRQAKTRRFHGPGAGSVRQYGTGTPGSGGAVPVLGAQGPARVGSTDLEIRLRRALGGAPLFFVFGLGEGSLAGFPLAGLTTYVDAIFSIDAVAAAGPVGAPGEGTFDFQWTPGAGFANKGLYAQAFVVDPGAAGLVAQSGGLELLIGP